MHLVHGYLPKAKPYVPCAVCNYGVSPSSCYVENRSGTVVFRKPFRKTISRSFFYLGFFLSVDVLYLRSNGYLFLKQLKISLCVGMIHKVLYKYVVKTSISTGDKAHAHVVRHIALNDGIPCTVNGLVKPVWPASSLCLIGGKGFNGCIRSNTQAEVYRVRRQHHLLFRITAKGKALHPMGFVLVIHIPVKAKICAFRNTPKLAMAKAFLFCKGKVQTLVNKAILVKWQKQLWHKIFKSRTRPACHSNVTPVADNGSAQTAPMLKPNLSKG